MTASVWTIARAPATWTSTEPLTLMSGMAIPPPLTKRVEAAADSPRGGMIDD
jgi:hypothetical protein